MSEIKLICPRNRPVRGDKDFCGCYSNRKNRVLLKRPYTGTLAIE